MTLDPVVDPSLEADSDSGWEYEYHDSETESFYLTLDLSSLHGPLRPPRRRPTNHAAHQKHTHGQDAPAAEAEDTDYSRPLETTESHPSNASLGLADDRLQILGLHTLNPIVSYQNHIFSCSWADQLGTELLFTPPEETDSSPVSLTRGKDFDLIAANSVKLLGRKANLISSSGLAASELSTTTSTKPSNQASFLDRLAQVKQARGETDTVRTVFSTRRTQNLEERLRGWARTEEQMGEVQRLQEGVMRGDSQATAALERLYLEVPEDQ